GPAARRSSDVHRCTDRRPRGVDQGGDRRSAIRRRLAASSSRFQASLWDGEQAGHSRRANALRVLASSAQQEADSHRSIYIGLFNAWLQAKATNDAPLATFYE